MHFISKRIRIVHLTCMFFISSLIAEAQRNEWIIKDDLLFPMQEKHVHGSSIVALPNGDLLAVWFEGSGERHACAPWHARSR